VTFSLPSGPASWLSGFFLLPPLPSLSHTPVGNSTWTWSVAAGIIVRQTGTYDLLGGRSGPERHFHVPDRLSLIIFAMLSDVKSYNLT